MSLIIKQAGLEEYLEGSEKIKVLLVGPPGAGKTRMSGFAPRPIFADCDGGILSVADLKVPYGRIKTEEDMNAFLDILVAEARKPEAQRRFETVVVDTLDRYQRSVIQGYLKRTKRKEMDGWEDWGYLDAAMNRLISTLMELPFHVIFLGHVRTDKDGYVSLDLQGQQRDKLPGDFDFVGMFENQFEASTPAEGQKIRRVIKWEATPKAEWLKARGGGLRETEASFDANGFANIKSGIEAQIKAEKIAKGEVIQEVQTTPLSDESQVMAPQAGGPVSTGLSRGGKPAAAPGQATLPAPPPAPTQAVTPPPPVKAPAPVKPPVEPVTEPPVEQPMANGVKVIEDHLGGKVISDPDAPKTEEVPVAESSEDESVTDVDDTVIELPKPEPAVVEEGHVPTDGEWTTFCGAPRSEGATPTPGVGCGQPITVVLERGRIVGCTSPEGQVSNLIDIGAIKYQAILHNPCFAKARNNNANANA